MKYSIPALAVLLLAGSAAFMSPAAAQPAQACLRQNMVNGWKVVDDQNLIVIDRVGRQFSVALARAAMT